MLTLDNNWRFDSPARSNRDWRPRSRTLSIGSAAKAVAMRSWSISSPGSRRQRAYLITGAAMRAGRPPTSIASWMRLPPTRRCSLKLSTTPAMSLVFGTRVSSRGSSSHRLPVRAAVAIEPVSANSSAKREFFRKWPETFRYFAPEIERPVGQRQNRMREKPGFPGL